MRSRLFTSHLAVATGVIMAFCLQSHAARADPAALITAFGDQTRQMLADTELAPSDRQQRFHALVDRNFDFPVIVRFVLGRYWQTTADDVRQEFARVFEDYVIEGYAGRLNEYIGQSAAVTAEHAEGDRTTIVATRFAHANGDPPTAVEWRVQTTTDGLKITDVSVWGVSMALSYREQFAAAIQRNGGQAAALIPELRGKLTVRSADASSR